MKKHLSLVKKIDLLMKEESSIYGNNPYIYSEQAKAKYYKELLGVLEKYNKEYLEDLGINLMRVNFSNQLRQKPDNK